MIVVLAAIVFVALVALRHESPGAIEFVALAASRYVILVVNLLVTQVERLVISLAHLLSPNNQLQVFWSSHQSRVKCRNTYASPRRW